MGPWHFSGGGKTAEAVFHRLCYAGDEFNGIPLGSGNSSGSSMLINRVFSHAERHKNKAEGVPTLNVKWT